MKTLITLSMKSGNQLETVLDPEDCEQFIEEIGDIQHSSGLVSFGDILFRPCEVEGIATRTLMNFPTV